MTANQTEPSALQLRPGMDVYSADQNRFVGSVVAVLGGDAVSKGRPRSGGRSDPHQSGPALRHEEGRHSPTKPTEGTTRLGEEMGPVPTLRFGNSGPLNQSASQNYATGDHESGRAATHLVVRPGRLNLGPLARLLYVPTSRIRSISMERVVIELDGAGIPGGWRQEPS